MKNTHDSYKGSSLPIYRGFSIPIIFFSLVFCLFFVGGVSGAEETISIPRDAQTTGLSAWHHAGQTFLTFNEIVKIMPDGKITYGEFYQRKNLLKKQITYNIYRSTEPIKNLHNLKPIATIDSLSEWDEFFYGITAENIEYSKDKPAIRYVARDGAAPLANGKGIYVFNPSKPGRSFYAVTAVVDGKENTAITPGNNSTKIAVEETVGQGLPVLQRVETPAVFAYIKNPKLYFYVRWESPPNASIQGKPFDYLVGIPPHLATPAPLGIHMHCSGGNLLGGYAWWNNAEKGAILLSSNEIPYDWWTGYHEKIFTKNPPTSEEDWKEGVVHPYTTNRLWSFVKYLNEKSQWKIDMTRIFTAGASMGGTGSLMMAIRYPDKIAWARSWVGAHVPIHISKFVSSFARVWGDPSYKVSFENGTPVWDYYNDAKYLLAHPKQEIGFLTFSNAKNDPLIDWAQSVEFLKALEKTKRPFLFIWGQSGHGQRTIMPENGSERVMPIDITTNTTLPAFTRCSLDDNPGNGDPNDGAPSGQINRWLYWKAKNVVDNPDRWEMTFGLMRQAPRNSCRVDITPRRVQHFKPQIGQKVRWENRTLAGKLIEKGVSVVDPNGLITLEQVSVYKRLNRITISLKAR